MPSRKRIQSKRGGIEVEEDVVCGVEIKGVEVDAVVDIRACLIFLKKQT